MTKILIAGAGGAPSDGVINSLLESKKHETIIGMGSEPTDLVLSPAERKYYVPYADQPEYKDCLLKILEKEKPDLIHFQNDLEIYYASLIRDDIHAAGTKTFMPPHDVIDTCVNKYKSYLKFKQAGIKVPTNMMINDESDLERAFAELGTKTEPSGCVQPLWAAAAKVPFRRTITRWRKAGSTATTAGAILSPPKC